MAKRRSNVAGHRIAPARFLLFAAVMAAVGSAAAAFGLSGRTALLIGFDMGASAFVAATLPLLGATPEAMRRTAASNDVNRAGLLAISVLLSLVVLFAVGTLIAGREPLAGRDIALIVITLALAWLFANLVFALHYAHLFYLQSGGRDRGGIAVPGADEPSYWDFFYFSITLGMTFQTSDVTITSMHMRRVVIGQCLAAFLFNMGILAFTVNAIGSA